ncbi:MAG: DegT/DnrJ/EryC1/StrS family aminotransferase [Flavobacteriales bacterium]|nr:DegT/DnrJ/EryC1/StrS family aminotransferase [Flavobacteriales bacterium]MCB9192963.1 DegT/DnrJ/EryC1/StrS family aminotransferase [Flavobacteriales bacterium]
MQMVDLVGQYHHIKPEVDAALQRVLESAQFIGGPDVKGLEQDLSDYLGCRETIACANGTDALQIALMALDLKPGDEVITTAFTFVATVEVVGLLGITPVFADVHPDTFLIDPEDIRRKITPNTKAIVPVHLFGQCADMGVIMAIAKEHGLQVVEDNAQAIGAEVTMPDGTVRKAGTIGTIGTTSFFPSKNLGCYGDGGALFTNDERLARRIRQICNHGSEVRYYHDILGVNSRLDALQAAVLRIKLRHLDAYAAARNTAARAYDGAFAGNAHIRTPKRAEGTTHVFHQYTLRITNGHRDALKAHLEAQGIPAMVYYPVPLHLQKAYSTDRCRPGDLPVSEALAAEVLSLPMHTELDADQLAHITGSVLSFFSN